MVIYAPLSSNPLECQYWGGGGQANFGNAKILRAYDSVTGWEGLGRKSLGGARVLSVLKRAPSVLIDTDIFEWD